MEQSWLYKERMAELTLLPARVTWWQSKSVKCPCVFAFDAFHCFCVCNCNSSTLAVISCCRPLDRPSPSPVECGWGCGPHRAGGSAAWARSPQRAPPDWACRPEECTICRKWERGTCSSHTGRCARYRRTLSGIPAWTGRQRKQVKTNTFTVIEYVHVHWFTQWVCTAEHRTNHCVIGSLSWKVIDWP